jgi:hypothetical protein
MTHQHTLKIEAARAGVATGEYLARLAEGLVYCWRCEVWHQAGDFDVDRRRHTRRAGSCRRAILAARAGVTTGEYLARLAGGLVYCRRCKDWHPADYLNAGPRRPAGLARSCRRAILVAAVGELAADALLRPPAVWVVRRPEPERGQGSRVTWSYWRGPVRAAGQRGRLPGEWSPALDDRVARFAGAGAASGALIATYGRHDAVPPGCRLVRLA